MNKSNSKTKKAHVASYEMSAAYPVDDTEWQVTLWWFDGPRLMASVTSQDALLPAAVDRVREMMVEVQTELRTGHLLLPDMGGCLIRYGDDNV